MFGENNKRMNRAVMIKAVAIVLLGLFALSVVSIPSAAHMPGASETPEFELEDIIIEDGGKEIDISMDDIGEYHNEKAKEQKTKSLKKQGKIEAEIDVIIEEEFAGTDGKCPCTCCAFRAALLGISMVWGDEIPTRDDISIISNLSSPGSCQCFQYITGTGPMIASVPQYAPGTKGEFRIILPNGTEVKNKSMPDLKKNGANTDIINWHFNISRKSTGDYFTVDAKDDVFPDDFFELRRKVKYDKPEAATEEETEEFVSQWEEVRDTFLTREDWELFEGVDKPEEDVTSGILFLVILGISCAIGVICIVVRWKSGVNGS